MRDELTRAVEILVADIERPDNLTPEEYESAILLFKAAPALVAAAKAAQAYDTAIQRRVVDGQVRLDVPGVGIAQGDDLDALYLDWITKANDAMEIVTGESDA